MRCAICDDPIRWTKKAIRDGSLCTDCQEACRPDIMEMDPNLGHLLPSPPINIRLLLSIEEQDDTFA